MHWDEARVAYWTLRYARNGVFHYRPIIHGPFVPLVTAPVFEWLGPSDFTARLPVAVIGGLAPLTALLFRRPADSDRLQDIGLDDAETVALAALLAVTPLFVYYSRFMRSDVPLAVFALVAVGFVVRALATGRRRYVVVAGFAVGLALPTKENVLVYVACAVGAAAVAACWPAVSAWVDGGRAHADAAFRASLARIRGHARQHRAAVPVALVVALVPVVFFFAPRGSGLSLDAALAGEASWLAVVARATVGTWETFTTSLWARGHDHSYPAYFGKLAGYTLLAALPVVVAAGYAFANELRSSVHPRPLVVPFVAWGVAALVGYPLGTDIAAPWISIHIVLPLVVPAAIGAVALARERRWRRSGPGLRATVLALLVVLSAVSVPAVIGLSAVTPPLYANVLAQAAQPADDLDPMVANITDAADDGGVLYYGEAYYLPDESIADRPPAGDTVWLGWWVQRLPMAWYVEQAEASTAHAWHAETVRSRESLPPVVFAHPNSSEDVRELLENRGYERRRYDLTLYADTAVVVFVDAERLAESDDERALTTSDERFRQLRRP